MKKMVAYALALSATALMACPMGQGMMGQGMMGQGGRCTGGLMEKCQCDPKQLPRALEALDLSDKQKEDIIKLREEGKAFHNQQHDKMMAVLTPEQRGKLEYARELRNANRGMGMKGGMGMSKGGAGCKMGNAMGNPMNNTTSSTK